MYICIVIVVKQEEAGGTLIVVSIAVLIIMFGVCLADERRHNGDRTEFGAP